MTMTKNEITALAQDIARDQGNDTTLSAYYDEVIEELGKIRNPPLVERDIFAFTDGTATYDYPAEAVEILHMFLEGYQLMEVDQYSLEAYDKTWRDDEATPKAWKRHSENARKLRIFPIPDTTSDALGIGATEPFGEDFPSNSAAVIYSDSRESGIPEWIGCYVAFQILYKEFIRPSDHQDIEWAVLLKEIAEVFYQMGVMRHGQRKSRPSQQTEETFTP